MLLSGALLLLSGCATSPSISLPPQPVAVPQPPAAAQLACPAPVRDPPNATLAQSDATDAQNNALWAECITYHTAAQQFFNLLRTEGYLK